MITHVVLYQFHDPNDAAVAKGKLDALRGRIKSIRSLAVGVDAGRSDSEWQLALTTTHDDWDALETYREAAAHREVVDWLAPRVAARANVDFETTSG